ncbi:MAG: hypothetical protein CME06_15455 [Gemmatimonadetes bacterium]|nr:hypothetical protein [Gemmatimonadota bacterium]
MLHSTPRTRLLRLLLTAAAGLAALPGNAIGAETPEAMPPYNILFLTVDAFRSDHMGCYGYARETSPRIDAFAKEEATLFRNSISHSAWTVPGVVSLLTGQYPATHGIDTRHKIMDEFFPAPLKKLSELGYTNFGYVATGDAFSNVGFNTPEEFVRPSLQMVLERYQNERFTIWYHLKTTHLPYAAKSEIRERFRRPDSPEMMQHHTNLVTGLSMIKAGATTWDPATKPTVEDLYDACVYEQDEFIGQVFEHMKHLGLWDNTIIILTSDHGEELLEHGLIGHASTTLQGTLFDEVLRIPLLIRIPGIPGGGIVESIVQPSDVIPTVFEALGLPPVPGVQGLSLLPAIAGSGPGPNRRYAFSETTPCGWQCPGNRDKTIRLKSVRSLEWKLVVRVEESTQRTTALYDLKNDPAEITDVAGANRDVVAEMLAALQAHEEANLEAAWQGIERTIAHRAQNMRLLDRGERSAEAATLCDELAMLRYVFRVQNPSVFDRRSNDWAAALGGLWSLVGNKPNYWVCEEL